MSLYGKLDTNTNIPKYLDRGQIPAISVTSAGSGYTTVPSVSIAAPAAPTGIQATATARMAVDTIAVNAAGTGYAVNDILTLVGGTGAAATVKVLTLGASGAVATIALVNAGLYSALPTTPTAVAVTGGSGSSATFNTTFKVNSLVVTNPGSGYVANDAAGVTLAGNATAAVAKHGNVFVDGQNSGQVVIFVSVEEAAFEANRAKGLSTPGWYLFRTYVDSTGTTRYKAELLSAVTNTEATDNEVTSDDAYAADSNSVVAVTVHPTAQLVAGGAATFGVTATTSGGETILYQWQKKVPGGRWTNINKTAASADLTSLVAADNGNQYRAVVGNDGGALKVYSNAALLTYTPTYISVQPTTVSTSGGNSSFSVTAIAPSGTMSYQWQTRVPAGTWGNAGTDSNTLALTGQTETMEVRVTVSNSNGDAPVVSNTVSSIYSS